MSDFDPLRVVSGLPHLPGVYRMLNARGEALYVGKALDLKKRVGSYFARSSSLAPRIRIMLGQVASIETTATRSEAEALLLESNLIKALSPRYNILFRDDKSYPYLVITGHPFPRLAFHRGPLDKQHRYFGPFPSAGAVRESIQLLQKVFRLRTCEDSVYSNRSRPCLLHQIRRCSAPCVGRISEAGYGEEVASAVLFLGGGGDALLDRLEERMRSASEALQYEEAAVYRNRIAALRKVREKQFVSGIADDTDVIAFGRAAGIACVNLVMIRNGRHLGDKNFYPSNAEESTPEQIVGAFLQQHYLQHGAPARVVVGAKLDGLVLETLLSERAGHPVRIDAKPAGARKAWLDMAERNAQLGAGQALGLQASQEARLGALQQALGLPDTTRRIECFDVSHTQGEATVAACVVYDCSEMQKGEYRRYNVSVSETAAALSDTNKPGPSREADRTTGITPGDDYAAMRDALTRRYRKIVSGEGRIPDLVIIDGGRGQLSVAAEVFAEQGMSDVALVAVSKGEARRPGQEQLWIAGRAAPLVLGPEHPALHLIQAIRDEAHRFAIQGHRARRGRARVRSPLEQIPGVGATRRQRLLTRFGGMRGLLAASIDDLADIDGIGRALAKKIYDELH